MSKHPQQNYNFRSVQDFLDYLPADEREVVDFLRELVLDTIPDVQEKLSYNVPFYYRFSRICYIWPSSVPWGNVPQYGVVLGFVNGNLLGDEDGYLEKARRKKVRTITFVSTEEIDSDVLRSFLFEAVEIDEALYKERKG